MSDRLYCPRGHLLIEDEFHSGLAKMQHSVMGCAGGTLHVQYKKCDSCEDQFHFTHDCLTEEQLKESTSEKHYPCGCFKSESHTHTCEMHARLKEDKENGEIPAEEYFKTLKTEEPWANFSDRKPAVGQEIDILGIKTAKPYRGIYGGCYCEEYGWVTTPEEVNWIYFKIWKPAQPEIHRSSDSNVKEFEKMDCAFEIVDTEEPWSKFLWGCGKHNSSGKDSVGCPECNKSIDHQNCQKCGRIFNRNFTNINICDQCDPIIWESYYINKEKNPIIRKNRTDEIIENHIPDATKMVDQNSDIKENLIAPQCAFHGVKLICYEPGKGYCPECLKKAWSHHMQTVRENRIDEFCHCENPIISKRCMITFGLELEHFCGPVCPLSEYCTICEKDLHTKPKESIHLDSDMHNKEQKCEHPFESTCEGDNGIFCTKCQKDVPAKKQECEHEDDEDKQPPECKENEHYWTSAIYRYKEKDYHTGYMYCIKCETIQSSFKNYHRSQSQIAIEKVIEVFQNQLNTIIKHQGTVITPYDISKIILNLKEFNQ